MRYKPGVKAGAEVESVDKLHVKPIAFAIYFADGISLYEVGVPVERDFNFIRRFEKSPALLPVESAAAKKLQAGVERDIRLRVFDLAEVFIESVNNFLRAAHRIGQSCKRQQKQDETDCFFHENIIT